MLIRILLIEDNPADVIAFRRSVSKISPDVEVVDAKDFNHAFHHLEGSFFDRIFIDPDLQISMDFGVAMQDLVRYASNTPIQILKTSDPATLAIIRQLARVNDNVELIERNDRDALAGILERLIKEKSSGSLTGVKVDMARISVKFESLEKSHQKLEATLEKSLLEFKKIIAQVSATTSEMSIKLAVAMDTVERLKDEISALREEMHDVADVAEAAASKVGKQGGEEGSEKAKLMVAIVMAISTVSVGLGVPLMGHLFPKKAEDQPSIQASPSPTSSPNNKGGKK